MDIKNIAILGCKFLGIYALIQSIPHIGGIFQVLTFAENDPNFTTGLFLASVIPAIIMVAFSFTLFFYSEIFSKKMLPDKQQEEELNKISSKDLQTIAFSIVGLIMLSLAIPKIGQIAINAYSLKKMGDQRNIQEILSNNWAFTVQAILQLIIGFLLFIGSELLSSAWHFLIDRLRYERKI